LPSIDTHPTRRCLGFLAAGSSTKKHQSGCFFFLHPSPVALVLFLRRILKLHIHRHSDGFQGLGRIHSTQLCHPPIDVIFDRCFGFGFGCLFLTFFGGLFFFLGSLCLFSLGFGFIRILPQILYKADGLPLRGFCHLFFRSSVRSGRR